MNKKRILHVITTLNHGGAENVAVNFFRLVDKSKFTCDYLIYVNENKDYEEEINQLGGKVYCITSPRENYIKWRKEFTTFLKNNGPYDIVHSHNLFHSADVLKIAKHLGIKRRIAHAHTTSSSVNIIILKKIYDHIKRKKMLKYATDLVACGTDAGNYLFGKKDFTQKGIVINNDIDLNKFQYKPEMREKYRELLNVQDKYVILNVGRLLPVKNQLFLIELMKEINKEHKNVVLLIAGDGILKEELKQKINSYHLQENIILLGNRDDVPNILNAADVFIMPSLFEGLPLATIEAQANGLPVILSDTISKECNITGLVRFISLDSPKSEWVNIMLSYKDPKHTDTTELIKKMKYDTESNRVLVNQFYERY